MSNFLLSNYVDLFTNYQIYESAVNQYKDSWQYCLALHINDFTDSFAIFCISACTSGFFGRGCEFPCRCESPTEICNRLDGSCPLSGCKSGFAGPGCQICKSLVGCWHFCLITLPIELMT